MYPEQTSPGSKCLILAMTEMIKRLQRQFCFQTKENSLVSKLNDYNWSSIAFGKDALQQYAELLDEEETALLFQTVSILKF
jgi:hypothetical protein